MMEHPSPRMELEIQKSLVDEMQTRQELYELLGYEPRAESAK